MNTFPVLPFSVNWATNAEGQNWTIEKWNQVDNCSPQFHFKYIPF